MASRIVGIILGAAVLLMATIGDSAKAAPKDDAAKIEGPARAIDGDTLLMDGKRVRLFGVDAPEMKDSRGPIARGALDELIAGAPVTCEEVDRDRHGRAVARCRADGRDLGEAMIDGGHAFAYRIFTAEYDATETAARKAGRGFWARASIDAPRQRYWVDYLSALLTPMIAFVLAVIAYWQWRVNHRRLMIEMFEKRYAIYEVARDAIKDAVSKGDASDEIQHDVAVVRGESRFFFKSDFYDYLGELLENMTELWECNLSLRSTPEGDDRKELVARRREALDWIRAQNKGLIDRVMPYMDLTERGSD